MATIASLGIKVDSTQVKSAQKQLADLRKEAGSVEKAFDKLTATIGKTKSIKIKAELGDVTKAQAALTKLTANFSKQTTIKVNSQQLVVANTRATTLLASLSKINSSTQVKINSQQVLTAQNRVKSLASSISNLPSNKNVNLNVSQSSAGGGINASGLTGAVTKGTLAAGAITAVLSKVKELIQELPRLADEYTSFSNRLALVSKNSDQLAFAQQKVIGIAINARQPLDAVTQIYQRLATNASDYGISLNQVASITETVTKAVAISGASTESAQAALVQFGQGLASGVLRGQEFNSVLEQTPALAYAIADGLGVQRSELRKLANDGKLTVDVIVEALENMKGKIDEDFGKTTATIKQTFNQFEISAIAAVGNIDKKIGASQNLIKLLNLTRDKVFGFSDSEDTQLKRRLAEIQDTIKTLDKTRSKDFEIAGTTGLDILKLPNLGDSVKQSKANLENYESLTKESDELIKKLNKVEEGEKKVGDTGNKSLSDLNEQTKALGKSLSNLFDKDKLPEDFSFSKGLNLGITPGVTAAQSRFQAEQEKADAKAAKASDKAEAKREKKDQAEIDSIDKKIKAYESEAVAVKLSADARERYMLYQELSATTLTNKEIASRMELVRASELFKKQNEDAIDVVKELDNELNASFKGEVKHNLESLAKSIDDALGNKVLEKTKAVTTDMSEFAKQAARNMQSSFADFLFDPFSEGLDGMVKGFLKVIQRIAAEAAAAQIFKAIGNAASGSDYSWLQAIGGAISSGSGKATGGNTQGGRMYPVNELGPELYTEGGKTYLMSGENGYVTPITSQSGTGAGGSSGQNPIVVNVNVASDGSTDVSTNEPGLQQFGKELGAFVDQRYNMLVTKDLSDGGRIKRSMKGY